MNTEANLNIIYTSGAAGGYRVDIMMTSAKQYLKPRRQKREEETIFRPRKTEKPSKKQQRNVELNRGQLDTS